MDEWLRYFVNHLCNTESGTSISPSAMDIILISNASNSFSTLLSVTFCWTAVVLIASVAYLKLRVHRERCQMGTETFANIVRGRIA